MPTVKLHLGDCLDLLRSMPDGSVDAVITDPPYPEIDRPYGRLTERQWWALVVEGVVPQVRRILKPSGSAVFILQPNSRRVGSMRGWLFEFQAWACRHWNMVQDAYWWNFTAPPTVHSHRKRGLMRPSMKHEVWLGPPDCFRDQDAVLWSQSDANKAVDRGDRALNRHPSGLTIRPGRCAIAADERGGVTPFNVLPAANTDSRSSAGSHGHGAGTPQVVASWWTRYICPPGGVVCDPFTGSGTMALAALDHGCHFVGAEAMPEYHELARRRIAAARRSARDAARVGMDRRGRRAGVSG